MILQNKIDSKPKKSYGKAQKAIIYTYLGFFFFFQNKGEISLTTKLIQSKDQHVKSGLVKTFAQKIPI